METHGSHRIDVDISSSQVRINSEFMYDDTDRPGGIATDEFTSVDDAKRRLDSLYKLYERFNKTYKLLLVAQTGEFLINAGGGVDNLINHSGSALGGDILRLLGIIGIGIVTIVAEDFARDNKLKTSNKLLAVRETEQSGKSHYRDIYTL